MLLFCLVGLVYAGVTIQTMDKVPVAFSVGTPRVSNNGHISIEANITDLSRNGLLQVDADIGSVTIGICNTTIQSNATALCSFDQGPFGPVACSQLPSGSNYTLTFKAYFLQSTKTTTQSFPVTGSELGCG